MIKVFEKEWISESSDGANIYYYHKDYIFNIGFDFNTKMFCYQILNEDIEPNINIENTFKTVDECLIFLNKYCIEHNISLQFEIFSDKKFGELI